MDIVSYLLGKKSSGGGGNTEAAYEAGREAGKQEEYDRFWDNFQQNGTRDDYQYAFGGHGWNDETFKPKYDIVFREGWQAAAFRTSDITDLYAATIGRGIKLDTSRATSLSEMFSYCYEIVRIPPLDLSNMTSHYAMFAFCNKLITIDELITTEQTPFEISMFQDDFELVNLFIKGTIGQNGLNLQWSTKLSHDSLMSIINALKDYSADTSGTEWIITFGSENLAKLTEDEKNIAYDKGWSIY